MKEKPYKKIFTWAGRVLMVASIVFIVLKVRSDGFDFTLLTSSALIGGLIAASLAYGGSIFYASFVFIRLLRILTSATVNRRRAIPIYCSSNLYKYLPGNFMHFVGRNRIAAETEGISHAEVATATVIDSLFLCFAAAVISAICVFQYAAEYLRTRISPTFFLLLIGGLVLSALLAWIFRRKLSKRLRRIISVLKRFRPAAAVRLFFSCCLRLLVLALTYFAVLLLLGQTITLDNVPKILGLCTLSWVVGFVMPGAPGGLGVREAILIAFLGDVLSPEILASSAIIHRIVCIFGDLFAYGFSLVYSKYTIKTYSQKLSPKLKELKKYFSK